jgi:hypothetical protein
MATVNQEFQSGPMGRRVIWQMLFAFAVLAFGLVVSTTIAFRSTVRNPSKTDQVITALAPFAGVLIAIPAYFSERATVEKFRIEENVLVLGKRRFPMAGMVEATRDPDVLRGARRVAVWEGLKLASLRGRKGFASIQGFFKSKRVGKFYAFLTGTEKAVVLRWPDKAVAVSPSDPDFFIYMARSAAGLR